MAILQDFLPLNDGYRLGLITLDNPSSLNAQNLAMVTQTAEILRAWADDESVLAVLMRGSGEKSFCAGGDIRSLYHTYDSQTFPNPHALEFFSNEYALCQLIGEYAKPIIVWASGIVMGGGMGLATPASHRIVTETTMMAMPEVGIGLFPDAGGSHFLQKMPEKVGLFLGLTGARFNATDALALGVADYALGSGDYAKLLEQLQSATWQQDSEQNHHLLDDLLSKLHNVEQLGEGWALANLTQIKQFVQASTLSEFDQMAQDWQPSQNAYIDGAIANYLAGSPTSAALTWQIFHGKSLDLAQALAMEKIVAVRCCHYGEFAEGVRALLIDKDKSPKWRYRLQDLPQSHIDEHFVGW